MKILPVKQNVGQGLKVISRDRLLKKKEAKKLDYPVYKKFLQVFLKNLEAGLKENLLAVLPFTTPPLTILPITNLLRRNAAYVYYFLVLIGKSEDMKKLDYKVEIG